MRFASLSIAQTGRPGDRVRLDFGHFDLYGDDNIKLKPKHCPYDNVRIYDGFTNEAPLIGTYCWKSQPFSVYSGTHQLLVEFVSKVNLVRSFVHYLLKLGYDSGKRNYLFIPFEQRPR